MIADLQGHFLRQVTFCHRADHMRDFDSGMHQVRNQFIDRFGACFPGAFRVTNFDPLGKLPLLSNGIAGLGNFLGHFFIQGDDLVKRIADLARKAHVVERHAYREISVFYFRKDPQQIPVIKCTVWIGSGG